MELKLVTIIIILFLSEVQARRKNVNINNLGFIRMQFTAFMEEFDKHYDSKEEEEERLGYFKENFETVEEHNDGYEDDKYSYELEVNSFGDLKTEEINKFFATFSPKDRIDNSSQQATEDDTTIVQDEALNTSESVSHDSDVNNDSDSTSHDSSQKKRQWFNQGHQPWFNQGFQSPWQSQQSQFQQPQFQQQQFQQPHQSQFQQQFQNPWFHNPQQTWQEPPKQPLLDILQQFGFNSLPTTKQPWQQSLQTTTSTPFQPDFLTDFQEPVTVPTRTTTRTTARTSTRTSTRTTTRTSTRTWTRRTTNPYQRPQTSSSSPSQSSIPNSFDWRTKGAVTPVKYQDQCGSCWAFAAIGAIESAYFRLTGKLGQFSEQHLVDCDRSSAGCNGGRHDTAFSYLRRIGGVLPTESYPYQNPAKKGECSLRNMNLALPIRGYGAVKKDDEQALKEAVFKYGPVAITMTCTDRKFMFYKSGVFDGLDGKGMLHAMLVVGYGTETDHYGRKKDYWIVKNSYGLQWGEKGYIRLLRNKGNKCSIASDAFYPII